MTTRDIKTKYNYTNRYKTLDAIYSYYINSDGNEVNHGKYVSYYSDTGTIIAKKNYKDGKIHGHQETYEWGEHFILEAEGEFSNGIPIGIHTTYDTDDYDVTAAEVDIVKTKVTGGFDEDGYQHGIIKTTIADGTIISEAEFNHGRMLSYWATHARFPGGPRKLSRTVIQINGIEYRTTYFTNKISSEVSAIKHIDIETSAVILHKRYSIHNNTVYLESSFIGDKYENTICYSMYSPDRIEILKHIPVQNSHTTQLCSPISTIHNCVVQDEPGAHLEWEHNYVSNSQISNNTLRISRDSVTNQVTQLTHIIDSNPMGEFMQFVDDKLVVHKYYINDIDVLDDILATAGCDKLTDIDSDAMVFITIQYGELLLIPLEHVPSCV